MHDPQSNSCDRLPFFFASLSCVISPVRRLVPPALSLSLSSPSSATRTRRTGRKRSIKNATKSPSARITFRNDPTLLFEPKRERKIESERRPVNSNQQKTHTKNRSKQTRKMRKCRVFGAEEQCDGWLGPVVGCVCLSFIFCAHPASNPFITPHTLLSFSLSFSLSPFRSVLSMRSPREPHALRPPHSAAHFCVRPEM